MGLSATARSLCLGRENTTKKTKDAKNHYRKYKYKNPFLKHLSF
jgi:hypothetical protein